MTIPDGGPDFDSCRQVPAIGVLLDEQRDRGQQSMSSAPAWRDVQAPRTNDAALSLRPAEASAS